jgi:hypothetical protein
LNSILFSHKGTRRRLLSAVTALWLLSACGRVFEDNGTHLADALEKGAAQLQASNAAALNYHNRFVFVPQRHRSVIAEA